MSAHPYREAMQFMVCVGLGTFAYLKYKWREELGFRRLSDYVPWALWCVGGTLNFVVMHANNSFMPVRGCLDMPGACSDDSHVALTGAMHLLWLADNYGPRYFKFSVGDMLVFTGLLWLLAAWIRRIMEEASR